MTKVTVCLTSTMYSAPMGQVFPQSRQEPQIVAFVSCDERLELTENASGRVVDAQVVCAEGATAAGGGGVRHLQQQQ